MKALFDAVLIILIKGEDAVPFVLLIRTSDFAGKLPPLWKTK